MQRRPLVCLFVFAALAWACRRRTAELAAPPVTASAAEALLDPPVGDAGDPTTVKKLMALRRTVTRSSIGVSGGCDVFASLGPSYVYDHLPEGGKGWGCHDGVKLVLCQETADGYYVPVDQHDGSCRWDLYYLPKDFAKPPVRYELEYERFDESDTHFTTAMTVDDLDADGKLELVLGRGYEHIEGVDASRSIYVSRPNGTLTETPFHSLLDVDKDGLVDAVIDYAFTYNDSACRPEEGWSAGQFSAPSLLLHRLARGGFSLSDDVARSYRKKTCSTPDRPIVVKNAKGVVDEEGTAANVLCRLADGADPKPLADAVRRACVRAYDAPQDCEKKRSGVCEFGGTILSWIDRFSELRRWLADGEVGKVDGGIADSSTRLDREAFCSSIAAESKKALQSMDAHAAEAGVEPQTIRTMLAAHKPPFGSCLDSANGAWAIALERLGSVRDMVVGSWSLVHGLANGTDARIRPFPLGKSRDNFGLHVESIVYNCPHVLATFDWDRDGDDEVVLSVISSGHETSESRSAVFTFKDGVVALYPPAKGLDIDEVQDVDNDGRPDIITSGPYSEAAADMGGGFFQVRPAGKLFVAHARPDGTFSFNDEIGKRAVETWCPRAERLAFRPDEDAAAPEQDEEKTRARQAQSVLCARIRGRSAASVAAEIRKACPSEAETKASDASAKELAEAEMQRRPYCFDRELLLKWVMRNPPLELR